MIVTLISNFFTKTKREGMIGRLATDQKNYLNLRQGRFRNKIFKLSLVRLG
jgi:hypothetical protein